MTFTAGINEFGTSIAKQAEGIPYFFIFDKNLLQLRAFLLQHQSTALRAACPRTAAGCAARAAAGCPGLSCRAGPCCAPGAVCRGRDCAACQAQHSACPGSCPGRCGEMCGGKEPPGRAGQGRAGQGRAGQGRAGAFCCHSCCLGQGDRSSIEPQGTSESTLQEGE